MINYNIGCQNNSIGSRENWINVDIENADIIVDLSTDTWPIENNSADNILASHILEHFTKDNGIKFLENCHRILKPGGKITIAVPDMDKFIGCALKNDYSEVNNVFWRDLNWCVGGDYRESNLYMRHYHLYNEASLSWTLHCLGFTNIVRGSFNELHNPDHQPISLYMEAVKLHETIAS